jgi:predicted ATPase
MENRGSEWRKWNFHVHTKGTNKNDQFTSTSLEDFFYTFFKSAYEKRIEAIGITDYFSIDRYKDAVKYVSDIESKIDNLTQSKLFIDDEVKFIKSIFLFPNVELRITPTTKKGKFINLHFLFNPKIIDQIENEFFNKLSNVENYLMNYDSICQYAKLLNSNLNPDQLYKYGIDNYNVEFGKIKTLLETNKLLKNNSIIAISSKSNDGVSGLKDYYDDFEKEGGSLLGTIKSIYKISKIIFSNAPSDKEYFLGKRTSVEEVINHTGSLKPCIIGCDSHSEATLFDRFTWVKSELTFEGLKQITFEPEERVKIQVEIPESEKLDNLMIEKVSFTSSDNRFTSEPIYFNKNLNVIIGGKSSGKSILLYEIAKTLYSNKSDDVLKYKDIEDNNHEKDLYDLSIISKNEIDGNYSFSVELFSKSSQSRKDRENQSSILPSIKYIPQNHLSNLVDKSRKNGATLKKLIRDLILEAPEYKSKYDDFVAQAKKNDEQRSQDIDFYFSLKNELDKKEKELLTKGDTKALTEGIAFNKQKIEQLNKDFAPEEHTLYKELTEKLSLLKIKENQINADFEKLDTFQTDLKRFLSELSNKKRITLDSLQTESLKVEYSTKLQFVDDALVNINGIAQLFVKNEENKFIENSSFAIEIAKINNEKEQTNTALKPFNDKLENQKQVLALQKSIGEDEAKIADIEQFKKEIETTKKAIVSQNEKIFIDFAINFELYQKIIEDLKPRISDIQSETDKIEILPCVKYNYPKFRKLADDIFDGRGFNNHNFEYLYQYWDRNPKSALADLNYIEIEKSLKILFEKIEKKQLLPKGGNTEKDSIKKIFTDFFFDHWDVKSQGDDIHKMSTGKASFVLLKLIIKLSKENGPILIDQPEDNLDNRSVSTELVNFLKEKKRERQIILVTHNPNIVVNADAENIIVANQKGQNDIESTSVHQFDYINGALENSFPKNEKTDLLKSMGIREHIAEIVEGGKEAFKKREEKYGFK